MIKDFASFATCQFSTLKRISGCLEDVVSHKTLDIKKYVCIKSCFYNFSRNFSSSLPIEMYRRPFLSMPSLHREYYRTL